MRVAILSLVTLLALAPACGGGRIVGPTGSREVELRPGQSVEITARLTLTFDAVLRDSRCPIDAICVTAGEAVVRFRARWSGTTIVRDLRADGSARESTRIGDVQIELVSLQPYPRASQPIDPRDYRATVAVTAH